MYTAVIGTMFTGATKIVKPEGQEADEFEQTVAQELFNLEVRVGFRRNIRGMGYVSVVGMHRVGAGGSRWEP